MVTKSAVIGIDMGASVSQVAYVGKGIVDIVQNEVSNRSTPTLTGYTDRERLLGDMALSQIRSNSKNTCRNFKHLIGRKAEHEDVQVEHFWSTCPVANSENGYCGYDINYKGESKVFTATEVTAMFMTKLKEITEKWCQAKVADAVIGVPSVFTDIHRQAMLDAAKIAGISVLRIMNEHTATALAYGIYKSNDFDPEKPSTVAFCSIGHSIFSVSIFQFVKGRLTVLCERSDKVGGRDMDECLMREFAAQFKKKHGCDPLTNKKASFKLEDAVTKTKKVLSANFQAPVSVECLMEDEDFGSDMNRDDFERMCQPMMERVRAVIEGIKSTCGIPVEEIDSVELVGGATRVPWLKNMCSECFGGKELSTTMNAEESVARGCALQAAILSPLFKVREFKVEDATPFGISVGWKGSSADAAAVAEEAAGDEEGERMAGAEGEYKTATVFPAGSLMNLVKMLTFYRKEPFDITVEYVDPSLLAPGTPKELGVYRIELPPQAEAKKVKVKAKLTVHGTFVIDSAQLVEEEEYEETVKEKRELPPDEPKPEAEAPAEEKKEAEGEAAAEGEAKKEEKKEPEKKEPEKKYEWVEVKKMKKRTKRTDLVINISGKPGYSSQEIQKLMDAETAMHSEMKEIIETDEKRNDLESYFFNMRDKITESGEYGQFISSADRDKFNKDLTSAEDWLYDNMEGTKTQFVEKLDELKGVGDAVAWRFKESGMRDEWIAAVAGTIQNYRSAGENPGEKYGHIAPEKLSKISTSCGELEKWLSDMKDKQGKLPKHERPVLICAEMEKKNQELAKMADDILKEPKPAPPKEEKKEEPKEEPKEEAKKEEESKAAPEPADGPQNMDVD